MLILIETYNSYLIPPKAKLNQQSSNKGENVPQRKKVNKKEKEWEKLSQEEIYSEGNMVFGAAHPQICHVGILIILLVAFYTPIMKLSEREINKTISFKIAFKNT